MMTRLYCKRGHRYTRENVKVDGRGRRRCRTCQRDTNRVNARDRRAKRRVAR